MLKPYFSPTLVSYGSLVNMTGDFGTAADPDVKLDPNGKALPGDGGSIDSCAQESNGAGGLKCICTDNTTC